MSRDVKVTNERRDGSPWQQIRPNLLLEFVPSPPQNLLCVSPLFRNAAPLLSYLIMEMFYSVFV